MEFSGSHFYRTEFFRYAAVSPFILGILFPEFLLILLIVNWATCSHFVSFESVYYDFFFECFDSF